MNGWKPTPLAEKLLNRPAAPDGTTRDITAKLPESGQARDKAAETGAGVRFLAEVPILEVPVPTELPPRIAHYRTCGDGKDRVEWSSIPGLLALCVESVTTARKRLVETSFSALGQLSA